MGTDALFENHTIKEIQDIQKKLRNDIEQKKEELRQMVGERYRDLMEAADTITEMKDIAESVTHRIKAIKERSLCLQKDSLQNGILPALEKKVFDRKKKNELLYSLASQMKVLVDAPTKIWASVESNDYLSAVSLFLLARHTHSTLLMDATLKEQNIFLHFPIINRQWTSINHLRFILSQNCKHILEIKDVKVEEVVGTLCCSCLLVDSSPQRMFIEVLDVRRNAIEELFKPEKSAKAQICEMTTVIYTTLQIIYYMFFPESKDSRTNLLVEALNKVTSKNQPGPVSLLDLKSSEIFKFLPQTIKDFRPTLKTQADSCTQEFLQKKCEEWLNHINKCFYPNITEILDYVNSVKSLAQIKKALNDQFMQLNRWDEVCEHLLQQPLSIWDFFLKECFFQRIKNIICEQIKTASEFCEKDIEFALHYICLEEGEEALEFERNISLYIWMESDGDILKNIAWTTQHQRNLWENGNLSMKALGFTPKVQSICKDVDRKLKETLQDINYFFVDDSEEGMHQVDVSRSSISKIPPSEEMCAIYSYLSEVMEKHFFDLASYFETMLLYLANEKDSYETSCRIVFLGHLCHALTRLCPHINACLSFSKVPDTKAIEKSSPQAFLQNPSKECLMWQELRKRLMESSDSAFRLWSKHRIDSVLQHLDLELNMCSINGLLKILLKWDKVEIQEESEQGNAIKSVLRIPQHISSPLSNALFAFCCQINSIGGHTVNSQVRSHIKKHLLTGLFEIYAQKVDDVWPSEEYNPRIVQIQSLQILFDIQFLVGLMVHKDTSCDTFSSKSQEIITNLVSRIDPFDMDVFSNPLQQNLKRALQKSLSLFGVLIHPEQVSYLNSLKQPLTSSQTEHNVMLSSAATSRFPLLPLSSRPSASSSSAYEVAQLFEPESKDAEVKTLPSHNSSPNLTASDIPTNPMKSTSFYDRVTAMSSSWFGN